MLMTPSGVLGFRLGTAGHPHSEGMCAIADVLRPFDEYARVSSFWRGENLRHSSIAFSDQRPKL